ncbi:MAG: saccharopine dehydrogenase NADP-binding domain-containing protein [Actinomycetales bacterium]|nr:saccharopine dehydrogenase NADP-binding domain-containing protein [Actinomycetales bacterium]
MTNGVTNGVTNRSDREFDIVLFGATGFVGRLTAAYLAEHAGHEVRIALAGRDRRRLEALRRQLPRGASEWGIVEADATEPTTLAAIAARARVVATTVGPYAVLGMPLVEACASAGTHYCDLTGELLFVRESIDTWHATAVDTGARIVHACGFDSIPSDLGVLVTADRVAADGEGELTRTTLAVRSLKGGISGGTIDSLRQQTIIARREPAVRTILADPYALSPDRMAEPSSPRVDDGPAPATGAVARAWGQVTGVVAAARKRIPVERDPQTGRWTGPFVMGPFNARIVRRSNALSQWRYGRAFRYREVVDFGSAATAPVLAGGMAAGAAGLVAAMSFDTSRAVVDRLLPKPGEGPTEEARAAGRFRLVISTRTSTGADYLTRVGADYDPGYDGTAVMLGESALALAFDEDRLPAAAGVLTPATGLGMPLVQRLRERGFSFDCDRGVLAAG